MLYASGTAAAVVAACQTRVAAHTRSIGAILALMTLVGGGVGMWDMHRRTIEGAHADLRDLGIVMAEQATRYVQSIDFLLREVQSRSNDLAVATPDEFRERMSAEDMHRFLANRTRSMPQAHATALFDAHGILLNTSLAELVSHYSVADRDYFQYVRDHPDSGMFVSAPAIGRSSGVMSIFLVRRISGPDGAFHRRCRGSC